MTLRTAHEGYEYQDLLTVFFILKEILDENDSHFKIDIKEYSEDKFDDLTITNSSGVFKKQIKYSNEITNERLQKKHLSQERYELALDTIFRSWNNHPRKENCEVRLCLAWQEPIDDLIDILKPHTATPTFSSYMTQIYQIDINELWPDGQRPLENWRRFRKESAKIKRKDFDSFCNHFVIETNFPKQSMDTTFDGKLEKIVLDQVKRLGIGDFPNDRISSREFALELIRLICSSRSRGSEINKEYIFRQLSIQTDFGSIEQVFPIDNKKNIKTNDIISKVKKYLNRANKIILTGEPGSGKSWFVQNLQSDLQDNDYNIIKHYCYTELKDPYSRDRITLNVFYGNLINDILKSFPQLKDKKEKRYASNLSELNNLLKNINEKTLLIVDGLDHIERIYESNRSTLSLDDIAIIDAISQLQISDEVKILVVSQPTWELEELSGFTRFEIPKWTKTEITDYFLKNNISDTKITKDRTLSDFLLEKSNGNPLYLNYLCEEIKNETVSEEKLNALPPYSYNLKEYYDYLLTKLTFDAIVPQVLSGANFSLSKNEIKEITGQGNKVDNAINVLRPVLKQNLSTGGFIIWHESFRRFIVERLKEENVDIEHAIYRPLIEWFERRDFYEFSKAYRFYFQLLFDNKKYDKILEYLNNDFVALSIYHGHSFDAVKSNYHYLAKSAIMMKDFPKIIQANEINKVLSSTEDAYQEGFNLYLSALGHLRGFKTVANYLAFEGKPTLPLLLGLEACYLCDQHQESAPWRIYFRFFESGKEIPIAEFKYYIRGLLVFKDTEKLIKVAEDIFDPQYLPYIKLLKNELLEYHKDDYIKEIKKENEIFSKIINYKKTDKDVNILSLAQQLLEKENIFEYDLPLLESFFTQIEKHIENTELIKQTIKLFTAKNWFYNWIIYFIRIKILEKQPNVSYVEVKEAFEYLTYDTEPFKGKPRTCDLYSAQGFIYNSLKAGLKFIKKREEWDEIIELLTKLSDDTTSSLQKSISGPLATNKLFQILDEHANDTNRTKVIQMFEKLISDKKNYHLHAYIAEYYFRLSKQYSIVGDKDDAEINFKEGIKYLFAYTFRRDLTIEDIVNAIVSFANLYPSEGNNYVRKMESLTNAVVEHTDGKDTQWYPVEWFQKYVKINFKEASLYLLYKLKETPYHWIHEDQLQALLIEAKGEINPVIELFIYRTFIIESSEEFLNAGLKLVGDVKTIEYNLAKNFLSNLAVKAQNKRDQNFTNTFSTNLKRLLNEFDFDSSETNINLSKEKKARDKKELIKTNCINRKNFFDMSIQELIEYFSRQKIRKTDLIYLYYFFNNQDKLTPELRDLVKVIVENHERYPKDENLDLDVIFDNDNDISAYYWLCKFVIEHDGWHRYLYNTDAFKKAYSLNPKVAIDSLIEFSAKFLKIGFNLSFSSNLLKAFIAVGYKPNIIKEMWEILYYATEFRLPAKEEINWGEVLSDSLDMSIEEIFICILFIRFKSNTTERHHWTLSGLYYLYKLYPEKMIKPTKWFLQHNEHFLKVNLLIILEILYEINNTNVNYHKNFEKELNSLYPTHYYLIDFIIENLLSKGKTQLISEAKLQLITKQDRSEFFKSLNYRNEILSNKGFDFDTIVGKYKSSFRKKYEMSFRYLYNSSEKHCVKNIYPANYLLELINQELYSEFNNYIDQSELYDFLHIDYKTIVAQTNSYIKRPLNIEKPSLIKTTWKKSEIKYSDWIRLAYYENEFSGDNNIKEYKVFEGIVFKDELEETTPYSRYRLFPMHLWENVTINKIDEFPCCFLIQEYDTLEDYKILWLNPFILNKLNLKLDSPKNGLVAKNKEGEVVIKYNRWASDYVGIGYKLSIKDEIPRLEGAKLICRQDYFKEICKLYKNKTPYLFRLCPGTNGVNG